MEVVGTILIFAYLLASIFVGVWASRKETTEGFLLGDRKLGSLSTFATIAASKTGGGLLLTMVAITYLYGFGIVGYVVGLIAGFLAFYFFAKKRLKPEADENKYYTLADYVFYNYGQSAGYLAAVLSFLVLCGGIIMQLIGGSKTVFEITGISYTASLLMIALVILFYLIMGGFKAVVKTDVLQYLAIIAAVVFVLFALANLGGINAEYLNLKEAGLFNIVVFIVFGVITPFFCPEFYQRVYATKSQQTLKRSFLFSITIYPAMVLLIVLIGFMIRTHLPGIDPETALIRGLIDLLPAAFLGVGGVLMFAAVMSSADTYVFTNTSVILQDFLLRNKKVSKERLVFCFRLTMAALVAVGVVVSYLLKSLIISTYLWGSVGTVLAVGIIATWIFRRLPGTALGFGFGLGLFCITCYMIITSFEVKPTIMGWAVAATVIGLIGGGIISELLKRRPSAVRV